MKTFILLSVVTSITLAPIAWAGERGGRFEGEAPLGDEAHIGGGARLGEGTLGSRPSFGSRSSDRQPLHNKAVGPSVRAATKLDRQQNRVVPPVNQDGQGSRLTSRFLIPAPDATIAQQDGLNGRTDHIFEKEASNAHRGWDRRRPYYFKNHWWAYNGYDWIGLDPGFYPWDYYPYFTYDYYPYDYFVSNPTDLPPAYEGTTSAAPAPDPTVTAVQAELSQQGYYGGPVDGLFGPTTRDAVARYQEDQDLTVSGNLTPDTLGDLGLPSVATN